MSKNACCGCLQKPAYKNRDKCEFVIKDRHGNASGCSLGVWSRGSGLRHRKELIVNGLQ